eukprot:jgi/Tetstr1/429148/TSEL_001881.t1
MASSDSPTRQRPQSAVSPTSHSGRKTRTRASSARAPRVDTWWKTPKGRVPYQPGSRVMSDFGTHPDNIVGSELNYSSWASPTKTKKLGPKELRQSVERLSQPYYAMRPMSAPVTRSAPLHNDPQSPEGAPLETNLEYAFRTMQMSGRAARKLTPAEQSELISRLYKVKELPEIPEKECLKLKYEFNPGLREGAGGYEEKWERVKIHNEQESIEAMSALKKRNDEKIAKLHAKLEAKYLQPLCTVKKKDEEVKEKIQLLFQGQGTVKRS